MTNRPFIGSKLYGGRQLYIESGTKLNKKLVYTNNGEYLIICNAPYDAKLIGIRMINSYYNNRLVLPW